MQPDLIQPETGQESVTTRLFSDAAFNVTGRIAISLVGIAMVPLMLHRLGAAIYGVWLAALAMASVCATVDLGMGWSVTREAAGFRNPNDTDTLAFLRTVLLSFGVSGLLGAAAITAIGFFSRQKFQSPALSSHQVQLVFLLVGLGFLGEWIFTYVQALLYGVRRFDLWNGLLISVTLVRAGGIAVLIVFFRAGLPAVAAWHALCAVCGAVVGLALAGSKAGMFSAQGAWFSLASLRSRLSFGVLSQLSATAAFGLWQAGPILLGYTASTSAVTSLSMGQRLPTALSGLATSMAETVFPAAAEHQSREEMEKSRTLLLSGTRWTLWPVLPACLLFFAIGPEILRLWISYDDAAASFVIRLVSLAILCDTAGAAALHLLWGRGRSGILFVIFAIAAGLAVTSMVLAAPTLGARGVAVCLLGASLVYAPAFMVLAARETSVPLGRLLRSGFQGTLWASLIAALLAFGAVHLLPGSLPVRLVVGVALAFAGWLLYTLRFGLQPADREALRGSRLLGVLRKLYPLRVGYYFLLELVEVIRGSHTADARFHERLYQRTDPYNYAVTERELDRHRRNAALIARFVSGDPASNVCEVGCSEGLFSERLEPLCGRLTAVDFSPVALERARNRRPWHPTTKFERFDILNGQPFPEQFDFVVAMHVVEFSRRSHNRIALRRLVQMVKPGGHLLLDSQRHLNELENALVRRLFYRGVWLSRLFARHPQLEVVEEYIDDLDVITIFRRRSSRQPAAPHAHAPRAGS